MSWYLGQYTENNIIMGTMIPLYAHNLKVCIVWHLRMNALLLNHALHFYYDYDGYKKMVDKFD